MNLKIHDGLCVKLPHRRADKVFNGAVEVIRLHSILWILIPGFIMVIDRRKVLLYGAASALRLFLFFGFPSLPDLLTGRVEISTPVTSFKRCMFLLSGEYFEVYCRAVLKVVSSV